MKMKRWLILAAAIMAAAVIFTGCPGGGNNDRPPPAEPMPATTLITWAVVDQVVMWDGVPGADNGFTVYANHIVNGVVIDEPLGVVTTAPGGVWMLDLGALPAALRDLFDDTHDVWVITNAAGGRPASARSELLSWEAGLPRLPGITIDGMDRDGVLTWYRLFEDADGNPVEVTAYGIYVDGVLVYTVPQFTTPTHTINVKEEATLPVGFNLIEMRALGNPEVNRPSPAAEAGWLVIDPPGSEWTTFPNARFTSIPGFSTYGGTGGGTNVWSVLRDAQGNFVHLRITERAGDHMAPHIHFAQIIPQYVQTMVTPVVTPLEGYFMLETRVRPGQLRGGVASAVGALRKMGMQGNGGFFWQHPFTWNTGDLMVDFMPVELPIRGSGDHVNQGANTWWDGMILSSCNVGEAVDMYFEDVILRRSNAAQIEDGEVIWRLSDHIMSLFVTPTAVEITAGPVDGAYMSPGETVTYVATVTPATAGQAVNWTITPGAQVAIDVAGRVTATNFVAPGPRTVTATVPGMPALTATRTLNFRAAPGLVLGEPSEPFTIGRSNEVTVAIVVGNESPGREINFADVIGGLPAGITASGSMTLNADGDGAGTITLSGTVTDPALIRTHEVAVTITPALTGTFDLVVRADLDPETVCIVEGMQNRIAGSWGEPNVVWLPGGGARITQNAATAGVIDFSFAHAEVPDNWADFDYLTVVFLEITNFQTAPVAFTFGSGFNPGARQFGGNRVAPEGTWYQTIPMEEMLDHGGDGYGFTLLTMQVIADRSTNFSFILSCFVFHNGPFDTSGLPGAQTLTLTPATGNIYAGSTNHLNIAVAGANITAPSGSFTADSVTGLPAGIAVSGSFTVNDGNLTGTLTLTGEGAALIPHADPIPLTVRVGAASTQFVLNVPAPADMEFITIGAITGSILAGGAGTISIAVTGMIDDPATDASFTAAMLDPGHAQLAVGGTFNVANRVLTGTLTLSAAEGNTLTPGPMPNTLTISGVTSPSFNVVISQPLWPETPAAAPAAPANTMDRWRMTAATEIGVGQALNTAGIGAGDILRVNGSIIVDGRNDDWHGIAINVEVVGLEVGDTVRVTGRLPTVGREGNMRFSSSFPTTPAPPAGDQWPTLGTPQTATADTFSLSWTVTGPVAEHLLELNAPVRINSTAENMPFIIDHIVIFQPDPDAGDGGWQVVLDSPYIGTRGGGVQVAATSAGIVVSNRGTGQYDHNNGLTFDLEGLRALVNGDTPAIVITGIADATTGRMDFQTGGGTIGADIGADGSFILTIAYTVANSRPSWAEGGEGFPFLGGGGTGQNFDYTVTGITVGGVDVRELLAAGRAAAWQAVIGSPYVSPRSATLTATDGGIVVSGRGTGQHDHNNGLLIDLNGIRALAGDTAAVIVIVGVADEGNAMVSMATQGLSPSNIHPSLDADGNFTLTIGAETTHGQAAGTPGWWNSDLPLLASNNNWAAAVGGVQAVFDFTVTSITVGGTPIQELLP